MLLNVLILILGLALVIFGAEFLVDGSTAVARKLNVSEFVIGLTVIGFGTSCPELVVSVLGALEGSSDIAVGNVIGSNIFNVLLILGVTAVIKPIRITEQNWKHDIPITIAVTVLLIVAGLHKSLFGIGSDRLGRADGIFFLVLFILYLVACFKWQKGSVGEEEVEQSRISGGVAALYIIGGLAGLIFGGRMFVNNSVEIARSLNISEKFIAITLLAGGTSLPELAASIIAASKGKGQMALGNILGSNIFNILLILGVASTISPISMANINWMDISALLASILVVWFSSLTFNRNELDRKEGMLLILIFLAYYIWLFIKL